MYSHHKIRPPHLIIQKFAPGRPTNFHIYPRRTRSNKPHLNFHLTPLASPKRQCFNLVLIIFISLCGYKPQVTQQQAIYQPTSTLSRNNPTRFGLALTEFGRELISRTTTLGSQLDLSRKLKYPKNSYFSTIICRYTALPPLYNSPIYNISERS